MSNAQIVQSTIYMENAKEIWKDLHERFLNGDNFRTQDLLQEIDSMKQRTKLCD